MKIGVLIADDNSFIREGMKIILSIPVDYMPDAVRKLAHFMTQRWLLDTVNRLQERQAPGRLALNPVILLAFAAVFALVAIYRFSRNNDVRQFV